MKPKIKIDPALLIGLGIPVVMTVLIAAAVVNMTFVGWIEE